MPKKHDHFSYSLSTEVYRAIALLYVNCRLCKYMTEIRYIRPPFCSSPLLEEGSEERRRAKLARISCSYFSLALITSEWVKAERRGRNGKTPWLSSWEVEVPRLYSRLFVVLGSTLGLDATRAEDIEFRPRLLLCAASRARLRQMRRIYNDENNDRRQVQ